MIRFAAGWLSSLLPFQVEFAIGGHDIGVENRLMTEGLETRPKLKGILEKIEDQIDKARRIERAQGAHQPEDQFLIDGIEGQAARLPAQPQETLGEAKRGGARGEANRRCKGNSKVETPACGRHFDATVQRFDMPDRAGAAFLEHQGRPYARPQIAQPTVHNHMFMRDRGGKGDRWDRHGNPSIAEASLSN